MATLERQPGREYTFTVTILDPDDNPVLWDSISGLAIILSGNGNRIIARWSKTSIAGFLPITQGTNPGEVQCTLPAELTAALLNEQTYIEVIRQEEISGSIVNIGMKDGALLPFIFFTTSALPDVPSLIP